MRGDPYERSTTFETAARLVVRVYRLSDAFPAEEKSGLTATLRRTAVGVPAKIAEASAASDAQVAIGTLEATQSTLRELDTYLLLAQRLKFARGPAIRTVRRRVSRLSALLDLELAACRRADGHGAGAAAALPLKRVG